MSTTLPVHHKAIDITAETCPMTFVRTRLALDTIQPGEILLVRLKGEDPLANVPRAAADQGHELLDLFEVEDGAWVLVIRKGERPAFTRGQQGASVRSAAAYRSTARIDAFGKSWPPFRPRHPR